MSASIPHPSLAPAAEPSQAKRRLPILPVAALLEEQQRLTAVERFSKLHDACELPRNAKYYRDLIPLERPRAGEQYAFEVDLDRCTGCKACVAACHSLNGLDEGEMFRTVGLLHGGTVEAPAQITVTTSCHHCLEPACMLGCPVKAYEKDPVTGIVKHLDDQCFGCQYCTLMCPYDAPKYNKERGIVRKCDLCSERLAHGEAPACVQACPNGAIAVRVVDHASVVQVAEAETFLPGAPGPEHTLPTTVYKTKKPLPANLLPADFYSTSPEHSHPALVAMLTLTQLSAGAFALGLLVEHLAGRPWGSTLAQATTATALALIALGASLFHLGRPHLAYRAFLGVRTSWLSREIIAFGGFAKASLVFALLTAAPLLSLSVLEPLAALAPALQVAAGLFGFLGVFCSVMVYVATRRSQWSGTRTGIQFFGTFFCLGAATVFTVGAFGNESLGPLDRIGAALLSVVVASTCIKLAFEVRGLLHARDRRQSPERRRAQVMLGDLRTVTVLRFTFSFVGGLLLPAVFLVKSEQQPGPAWGLAMLVALVAGEVAERVLFFRAAPASRMPGGLR
ncbi:MAG: DmsC/YnfH family molybdoenzyme membrane anchor subunit [Pseudomonadota bacterium]